MKSEKIPESLKVFGWASFFNDFGSDMIFPLWPTFLTSVMGANMEVVGLIDGLGDAVVALSQAISGYWSDKIRKRKVFVWVGYLFAGLGRIGYALSPTWHFILPFRVLDRIGKMRGAPRDAIAADLSTDLNRGKHFGYLRMMDNSGAVCGVIFSILFFRYLGYQNLFLIAAVPGLIASVLVFTKVRENKADHLKVFKGLTLKDFHRDLSLYLLLSTVFALSSFSYSFLLLFAQRQGVSVFMIPFLYLLYSAVASVTSLPFGRLADKIRRKPVLILSFLFWILACLSFIYSHSIVSVVVAFVFYGLYLGAIEPVQRALVSELSVPELRSSTLGTFQMVIGLAALPSSLMAGWLWENISDTAPFWFSIGLTFVALFFLFFVHEKKVSLTH